MEGRQRTVGFYAKILEINEDSGDTKVHFLKRKPETDSYVWADMSWSSADQVVRVVESPTLATGRGIAFLFLKVSRARQTESMCLQLHINFLNTKIITHKAQGMYWDHLCGLEQNCLYFLLRW